MSDQPDDITQGDGEVTEDVSPFDIQSASPADLEAHRAKLTERIDALGDPAGDSLAQAIARRDLRLERNTVVEAMRDLRTIVADVVDAELPAEEPVVEAVEDPAADAPVETPADTPAPEVELAAQIEGEMALAHAAATAPIPAAPAYSRPAVAYTAGAGQTAFSQGRELDMTSLTEAWKSQQNIRANRSTGPVRSVVAGLASFEESGELAVEILNRDSTVRNDRLIAESVAEHRRMLRGEPAPTAHAAAICDPLDIIREIPFSGVTATPFGDIFPQRPIGRLGFTYTPASSISEPASGIAIWNDEDQDGVDPDDSSTWKPTVLIECTDPLTVTAEELTTSATVDTSTEMSSPEKVAEFMLKLAVARARRREQYLLSLFAPTAINWNWTEEFGAYATLTRAVHTALPQLIYPERLDEGDYTLVLDPGFFNKLVMDELTKCNDADEAASNVLSRLQSNTGLRVVILRDFAVGGPTFGDLPAVGGGAVSLTALPTVLTARIVPTPAYIFGATGEEQTGWQTDPQLSRQNRKQAFSAEWILLAKHAQHPAAKINVSAPTNGARGGCIAPD